MENNNEIIRMPLIGDEAPEFRAITTEGKVNFPKDYFGKWVVLFSHPADFTPVCTTEFLAFAEIQKELQDINTELVGLSIDSLHSHIAWTRSISNISWGKYDKVEINFPIVVDINMNISKKYGMLHPNTATTQTVRSVFIIDPESKIRAILYYPMSTGRNMSEIKRMLIAMQKSDAEHVSTPANWQPGDDVILPSPLTTVEAKENIETEIKNSYAIEWYLRLRKDK